MSKEDDFALAKTELIMALEEFKTQCEASDDGEDFEAEMYDLMDVVAQ